MMENFGLHRFYASSPTGYSFRLAVVDKFIFCGITVGILSELARVESEKAPPTGLPPENSKTRPRRFQIFEKTLAIL